MGYRERVTDLHLPHIRALPEVVPDLFADAALRAREAGFDGVELHYAHAYTMSQFLSRLNDRDDGYGGSLENRVRLPLEVFRRVREAVGDDFTVGCRYLAEDCVEGGNPVEDAAWFGAAFARGGFRLPVVVARRTVRGRQAAFGRRRRLSLYRTERVRVHAAIRIGRARPVRPQCRAGRRHPSRHPGSRTRDPRRRYRRHTRIRAGRSAAARREGRCGGLRPAEPRRPRLVPEGSAWGAAKRSWCANTPTTARRSTRSTSRLPASSGTARSGTSPGIQMTADGKRRLTAPLWEPDLDVEEGPRARVRDRRLSAFSDPIGSGRSSPPSPGPSRKREGMKPKDGSAPQLSLSPAGRGPG